MIRIFFQDKNTDFNTRIDYVLNFIETHPLLKGKVKFSRDPDHSFDIICSYGISNLNDFFIPSQGLIFSNKFQNKFATLVSNQYTYQHLNLYSIDSKKKDSTLFAINKKFQFDIIETIFFHISRIEEWYCEDRQLDTWDMMQPKEQFLVKHNLHHLPIIDHLVFAFGKVIGLELIPQKTIYRITHDIDEVYLDASFFNTVRAMGGILWRRQKISAIYKIWSTYFSSKNTYDTFDWILTDQTKIEKCIYFLVGGTTKYDTPYNLDTPRMQAIFQLCKSRNYTIGIHPSYNCWRDERMIKNEKEKLEKRIALPIKTSRQHYLHFDFKTTPKILERQKIEEDSTLGFNDRIGFRCGTGFGYQLYDFENERPFKFIETPLVFMDSSLFNETNYNFKKTAELWISFLEKNKLHTKITFNFHNSRFYDASIHGIPLKKWYQELFLPNLGLDKTKAS